ncbi:MAG: FecR domain-containing protein [Acidobacteriota bacterium]
MKPHESDRIPSEEDEVARLLSLVPAPEPVPVEALARSRSLAREEWRSVVRRGRRRRWALGAVAAAAVGLVASWFAFDPWGSTAPRQVAVVEAIHGAVTLSQGGERAGRLLRTGDELDSRTVLETASDGRVSLRWADGQSLRMDVDSLVHLESPRHLRLARGAVYFDSGEFSAAADPRLEIRTDYGTVWDIGTQFEVRVRNQRLRVRVREGLVRVDQGKRSLEAGIGEELTIHSSGAVKRSSVSLHGDPWKWHLAVSPPFELEGSTLRQFLGWAARETGWRIEFSDAELERRVLGITLHGDLTGVTAEQAFPAVLETCGLVHRERDGVVRIESGGSR